MRRWIGVLTLGSALAGVALAAQPTKRPSDQERGKELYERHCVSCHGSTAGGDGPATRALVVTVPNLRGQVKPEKATIDVVVSGRGSMPAFEPSFDADDARRVVMYMGKLSDAPPAPEAEAEVPAVEVPDVEVPDVEGPAEGGGG